MYYKARSLRIFNACNLLFLGILGLFCVLPMIHLLAVSFSGSGPANAGVVLLWPKEFTLDAYIHTFRSRLFIGSVWISIQRAVLGTVLAMSVTLLAAYPLSKDHTVLKGRSFYLWFMVFTLLFNGGLIPNYLLIVRLKLINTFWSLVLPYMFSGFNVILMLNFFRSLPKELEEAAFIDGAGHFQTFLMVYVPLSLPAIATIALFNLVFHWNAYFDGLIYLNDRSKFPLASLLQTIIVQQDFRLGIESMAQLSQRTIKAAQIFIGALPILMVYPFLQKYFVKGVILGSIKE